MKRLFVTCTSFTLVSLLVLATTVLGAPVAHDSFESYTIGSSISGVNGGDGWFGLWGTDSTRDADVSVVAGGLSYNAGEISISGGTQALQYVASEGGVSNTLISRHAPGMGDTIYMSFLYQTQNLPNGLEAADPFIQIGMNPTLANPQMSVIDSHQYIAASPQSPNWWVRSGSTDLFTSQPSPDNQTHLVVMKATRNAETGTYGDVELFLNPTSLTESENVSYLNAASSGLTSFVDGSYFVVRKAYTDPNNTYTFDEVRFADTFADAVSNVQPSTQTRITTADGNGADTFVHWYSSTPDPANCNMGGKPTMETKSAGLEGGNQLYRKSYVRFDLSEIDAADLADAALELTVAVTSEGQTFNVYGLNDGNVGENWEEGTVDAFYNVLTDSDPSNDNWITWNNAPGNGDLNSVDPNETTFLGTFEGDLNGRKVGISGSELLSFLQADTDGLVTLIITRETHDPNYTGASHYFATKEHTNETLYPALLLTSAVPEPSTMVLLFTMFFSLAMLRHK